jgi:hypothetical protein
LQFFTVYTNICNPTLHERAKETVDGEKGKWARERALASIRREKRRDATALTTQNLSLD